MRSLPSAYATLLYADGVDLFFFFLRENQDVPSAFYSVRVDATIDSAYMYEREYVCIFSLCSLVSFILPFSLRLFYSVLTSLYEEGDWQPKSSCLLFLLSPIRSQNCLVIILVHLGAFVKICKVVKVVNQPLISFRPISSFGPIFYSPLFFYIDTRLPHGTI